MIIFQSTWPQLDISSCSYQSYSVIALILLYLAVPFFTATGCLCMAYILLMAIIHKVKLQRIYSLYNYYWNNLCTYIKSPSVYYDGSTARKDTQEQEGCGQCIQSNWKFNNEYFQIKCQTTAT